ncbi:MAG: response regulator transcription factor [Spirochaetales bacterium]|nr:response regulator transcription factor [Spirochaetales bacterium]
MRLLIVDDHEIVRKGLTVLLSTEKDIEVVGEARNGSEAVAKCDSLEPDVVLMDLVMPEMDGIEATGRITETHPDTKILVLTSFAADDKVFPAVKAGALGYLLKDSSPEELLEAIHRVHRGEPSLEPVIARKVLQEISHPGREKRTTDPLTERELEVLRLISQGLSNKEIASKLFVAEWTVRTHVSNVLGKLHLASRTQAALYALRSGLASLDDVPPSE